MNTEDPQPTLEKKSRSLAALLSLYQPGFGQLYLAQPRRAVGLASATTCLAVCFFTGLIGRSLWQLTAIFFAMFTILVTSVVGALRSRPAARPSWPWYSRWFVALALAVALQLSLVGLLPRVQRLKSLSIPSESMEPTLVVGDQLLALFDARFQSQPRRGQLVVMLSPDDNKTYQIKRIVAIAGDTIEIRDKQVALNGTRLSEPWAVHRDPQVAPAGTSSTMGQRDQLSPLVVPSGHVFVLGDNRDLSYDSRFYGPVPAALVRGEPLYVYWSPDLHRLGLRLDR